MRCTQLIGLSKAAEDYLEKNALVTPIKTCGECGHVSGGNRVARVYDSETGRRAGMFDDGPDLYEYELRDTSIVMEVVQATPWSSGPNIFICLRDEHGKWLCKWPQEEIDQC